MEKNFTEEASEIISRSKSIAFKFRHNRIDVEHLLMALLHIDGAVYNGLKKLNLDPDKVIEQIEDYLIVKPGSNIPFDIKNAYSTEQFNTAILKSEEYAEKNKSPSIHEAYLFLAVIKGLPWLSLNLDEKYFLSQIDEKLNGNSNNSEEGSYLERFGIDLTKKAKDGNLDPVIGREEEIRRSILILSRRTKNNPILIGEPGVGKTAIVEAIAQRISAEDIPSVLKGKTIYALDITSILAGAKYKGEFEDRIKKILEEVIESQNIILFIDEIHNIVGSGKSDTSLDLGNMLKPMLARGELRLIGATTIEEHRKYIEKDSALERRFQPVLVKEPSINEAISILRGIREKFEVYHGVRIADSGIVASVELSSRYLTSRFLPDKAIDLIDEAAATLKTEIESIPLRLDEFERTIVQLEIEREALIKEKDISGRKRLALIDRNLDNVLKRRDDFKVELDIEKSNIEAVKDVKKEIDTLNIEVQTAEKSYDFNKLAELRYGQLATLERKLKEKEEEVESDNIKRSKLLREEVTEEEIARVISKWTGIPINRLVETERDKILNLESYLNSSVIGQNEAVKELSQAIIRARCGMKDPNKPIGTFLFLGPTGVGKTHLANSLASYLFDQSRGTIRLDMSEYMDKFSVTRLIGAPPGYVGFEDGGQLTQQVKINPYSIVLFDEIEKAHSDVFNILLQIMGEGRLTDSKGKLVDFRNTIIIMTSNLGSNLKNYKEIITRDVIYEDIKSTFKPEFINRIDELILFNPLKKEDMKKIVKISLEKLNNRLENRNISFKFTEKVVDKIISESYDPEFGARPIERFIQKELETDIADKIVKGKITYDEDVTINYKDNKFEYKISKATF